MLRGVPSQQRVYPCKTCQYEYADPLGAEACNMLPSENVVYEPGDKVWLGEPHHCKTPLLPLKHLRVHGVINEVKGLVPPHVEQGMRKNVLPERTRRHAVVYEIYFECDRCQQGIACNYFLPDVSPFHLDS